jgi:hypothetical protein
MTAEQTDFLSAALRHVRDAEHLLESDEHASPDQAWHLAGFAHECARKALLQDGWVARMLGHDFDDASEQVIDVAIALDSRANRLPLRDWARRYPTIAEWKAEHRYERTGASRALRREVVGLVTQGRQAVDASVLALFLEGTLMIESLR